MHATIALVLRVDVRATRRDRLRALPSWLLGQLSIEARRVVGEVLAEHDVHRSQYALIASLDEFGPPSQTELSDRSGLDRSDSFAGSTTWQRANCRPKAGPG